MSIPTSKLNLSVVIPCYNQGNSLKETLERFALQTLTVDDFEVIVVDDGSADDTKDIVSSFEAHFRLIFLSQVHKGAAAARNLGAAQAQGDILLFLDADMIAEPDLFKMHLESHTLHTDTITIGRRKAWPAAQNSLFSTIIDIDSNVTDSMSEANTITYSEAFTCNLSVKASDFRLIGGFDIGIHRWEDIDFAYRACLRRYSFLYEPQALAYHNHPFSFQEFCRKMYNHYFFSVPLFAKHQGMIDHFSYLTDKRPIHWGNDSPSLILRKLARMFLAFPPILNTAEKFTNMMERRYVNSSFLRFLYWKIIASYELSGFRDGLKQYHASL